MYIEVTNEDQSLVALGVHQGAVLVVVDELQDGSVIVLGACKRRVMLQPDEFEQVWYARVLKDVHRECTLWGGSRAMVVSQHDNGARVICPDCWALNFLYKEEFVYLEG